MSDEKPTAQDVFALAARLSPEEKKIFLTELLELLRPTLQADWDRQIAAYQAEDRASYEQSLQKIRAIPRGGKLEDYEMTEEELGEYQTLADQIRVKEEELAQMRAKFAAMKPPAPVPRNTERDDAIMRYNAEGHTSDEIVNLLRDQWPGLTPGAVRAAIGRRTKGFRAQKGDK